MANQQAIKLFNLGFSPVLLGSSGDDRKRPLLKGWQKADYPVDELLAWPAANNIGIRCGQQRNGRFLTVFDFDEEAATIFPAWLCLVGAELSCWPVVVSSGRGFHFYCGTTSPQPSRTLAGRYATDPQGTRRLYKFIETLGEGRQVVSAGSCHPSGRQYAFVGLPDYRAIPCLTEVEFDTLIAISRTFDERPVRPVLSRQPLPSANGRWQNSHLDGIQDCLDYARRYIGTSEKREGNGDIRFLGQGGLLITANGRGWYSFSEETGGGLAELIAWHQATMGETA